MKWWYICGAANKEDYYLTSQLVLVCDSLGAAILPDPLFIILFKNSTITSITLENVEWEKFQQEFVSRNNIKKKENQHNMLTCVANLLISWFSIMLTRFRSSWFLLWIWHFKHVMHSTANLMWWNHLCIKALIQTKMFW